MAQVAGRVGRDLEQLPDFGSGGGVIDAVYLAFASARRRSCSFRYRAA